jgi:hypothetical protein
LEEAKTIAAGLRTAIVNGEYPPTPQTAEVPAAPVTLKAAADRFLEGVPLLKGKNQGKARGANDRQKLAALCGWTPAGHDRPLGELAAGSVTEDLYEAFIQRLRDAGRAASTVSNYIHGRTNDHCERDTVARAELTRRTGRDAGGSAA